MEKDPAADTPAVDETPAIAEKPTLMEKDPVCEMEVDPAHASGQFEYEGTKYYFCSHGCMDSFKADPAAFVK
jgi:YHS domain-containing protein